MMTARRNRLPRRVINRALEEYREQFARGRSDALLYAIAYCGRHRVVQPDWLVDAFKQLLHRWYSYQVRTFDEALGLPKRTHIKARRKEYLHKLDVVIAITGASARGVPINDKLFVAVAQDLRIPLSEVKKHWRTGRDEPEWGTARHAVEARR